MVFRTALPNQAIASLSANARAYGPRIRPLSDATTNHTPTDPGAPISKAPVACRFRSGQRERHRRDRSVDDLTTNDLVLNGTAAATLKVSDAGSIGLGTINGAITVNGITAANSNNVAGNLIDAAALS